MTALRRFTAAATWALAMGAAALALPSAASAHFQEILPSADIVTARGGKRLTVDMVFTHPMARGPVMAMGKPAQVGVLAKGRKVSLLDGVRLAPVDGQAAYRLTYDVTEPGDLVFFVEPAPYYEPAERKILVHYAKVVVDGFEDAQGWDALVGLPVEIRPLVRPYGLWTGNLFRGQVLKNGRPLADATVEVEWKNDGSVTAPAAPFVTQVVKADAWGVFAYAMPKAGWWGFAALTEGAPAQAPDGRTVPVELGGVMWVKTTDMK